MKVLVIQSVRLFVTPWTVAHQAPLSMGFSIEELTHLFVCFLLKDEEIG